MTKAERNRDAKECARAWAHGAIQGKCSWSASVGWIHSKFCDHLTETRMVAADRDSTAGALKTLLKALEIYLDDPKDDAKFRVVQKAMEEGRRYAGSGRE